ncbi:Mucolipin-2 [Phytophthora boehmeriae]|uniref:Mucolipin-2 n=1 Tax=Phytophthora boehmeriae TaxID=109152 RepID=A0A8T1WTU5_9STRA|nr:Mucolipin-2 [Phytophthora boehmeriae]
MTLLTLVRLVLHVSVALLVAVRSSQLGSALHPFQRALANDWIRLLFYVDTTRQVDDEAVLVTLPHFLLERQEEIAANVDDEFFSGGFAARASAMPVGALFTINETRQHVHGAVANYFHLGDVALDSYLIYGNDTALPPPLLTVRTDFGEDPVDHLYNITNTTSTKQWPAPLRLGTDSARRQETRRFFDELDAMELSFVVAMKHKKQQHVSEWETHREKYVVEESVCEWRVVMRYDLLNQGHLEVTMNYHLVHVQLLQDSQALEEEDDMPPIIFDTSAALNWITLLMICLYQVVELILKWPLGKGVAAHHPTTFRFSSRVFSLASDFWFWFTLFVNIVTAGCLLMTWRRAYRLSLNDTLCFTFAACCALQWGSLVRYLQVNARFHILGLTLRRGLPRVLQFLVGVLPIFVGFVLFGTVMFGAKVPRFQSASATATTLFSVANGDEIHDTFSDVAYTPWVGQIYVYSYMILFSYVVLMVCIGIIEDAFFSAVFPASWPTLDKSQEEEALQDPTAARGHRHRHQTGH